MKIVILQEALDELRDAIDYYDDRQVGLGLRLKEEIEQHVRWAGRHPTVPMLRPGGYRRINMSVFPYYIAYVVFGKTLWVLAIANSHKKPDYWIKRKNKII